MKEEENIGDRKRIYKSMLLETKNVIFHLNYEVNQYEMEGKW